MESHYNLTFEFFPPLFLSFFIRFTPRESHIRNLLIEKMIDKLQGLLIDCARQPKRFVLGDVISVFTK